MSVRQNRTGETIVPSLKSRYDRLLALLPMPMLLGVFAAVVAGVPTVFGVGVGGLPSAATVAYGLFVDPPPSG